MPALTLLLPGARALLVVDADAGRPCSACGRVATIVVVSLDPGAAPRCLACPAPEDRP